MYFKKIKLMLKRVEIVSSCINCQCVKLTVSCERCIHYYTVELLGIGKENAYRLSKVLHDSTMYPGPLSSLSSKCNSY